VWRGGDRVRDTGLADYRATAGNLGALIAVRDLDDDRAEVITLSWWPSMAAIRGFAGDDVGRAAYYPQDDRYLLTKPEKVQHYQSHGAFDPPTHGSGYLRRIPLGIRRRRPHNVAAFGIVLDEQLRKLHVSAATPMLLG
jgi:hypothetical protein